MINGKLLSANCFFKGLHTICGAGDPRGRHGVAIHVYGCDISMKDK